MFSSARLILKDYLDCGAPAVYSQLHFSPDVFSAACVPGCQMMQKTGVTLATSWLSSCVTLNRGSYWELCQWTLTLVSSAGVPWMALRHKRKSERKSFSISSSLRPSLPSSVPPSLRPSLPLSVCPSIRPAFLRPSLPLSVPPFLCPSCPPAFPLVVGCVLQPFLWLWVGVLQPFLW